MWDYPVVVLKACGTCVYGHELLSDDWHSAGRGGGRVKATAVRAVSCICAIWTSITHLLAVGAAIEASSFIGCSNIRDRSSLAHMKQSH